MFVSPDGPLGEELHLQQLAEHLGQQSREIVAYDTDRGPIDETSPDWHGLGGYATFNNVNFVRGGDGDDIPKLVYLLQELHISCRNIKSTQLTHGRLKSFDRIIARFRLGNNQQPSVDIFLMIGEFFSLLSDASLVVI